MHIAPALLLMAHRWLPGSQYSPTAQMSFMQMVPTSARGTHFIPSQYADMTHGLSGEGARLLENAVHAPPKSATRSQVPLDPQNRLAFFRSQA
jgi:hypothetical protein